jgi:hypothetical protein
VKEKNAKQDEIKVLDLAFSNEKEDFERINVKD